MPFFPTFLGRRLKPHPFKPLYYRWHVLQLVMSPYAADVVFFQQRRAQVDLIGIALSIHHDRMCGCGWLVARILKYLLARAKVILRRAMASQAPFHLQRCLLVHERHLVDGAVAGIAADAFGDVNAVIEKDEIRKLVYARPLQGLPGTITGADGLEELSVGPYFEWQLMQVLVGGMPAKLEVSTEVWQ